MSIIKEIDDNAGRFKRYPLSYYILGGGELSKVYCEILESQIAKMYKENQYFINDLITLNRGYLPLDRGFINTGTSEMTKELKTRFMVSRGLTRTSDKVKAKYF